MSKKIDVGSEFNVDDVFDDSEIVEYVERTLLVSDVFKDQEILMYVGENFEPEDVFKESELETWAAENGFTKSEA